ncbi:hypothetical protein Ancab_008544 [Ancistrocladus abbreviatus]
MKVETVWTVDNGGGRKRGCSNDSSNLPKDTLAGMHSSPAQALDVLNLLKKHQNFCHGSLLQKSPKQASDFSCFPCFFSRRITSPDSRRILLPILHLKFGNYEEKAMKLAELNPCSGRSKGRNWNFASASCFQNPNVFACASVHCARPRIKLIYGGHWSTGSPFTLLASEVMTETTSKGFETWWERERERDDDDDD